MMTLMMMLFFFLLWSCSFSRFVWASTSLQCSSSVLLPKWDTYVYVRNICPRIQDPGSRIKNLGKYSGKVRQQVSDRVTGRLAEGRLFVRWKNNNKNEWMMMKQTNNHKGTKWTQFDSYYYYWQTTTIDNIYHNNNNTKERCKDHQDTDQSWF